MKETLKPAGKIIAFLMMILAAVALLAFSGAAADEEEHVHVWGQWRIESEATCQKEGVKSRLCKSCMVKETELIPKEHVYGSWQTVKAYTCTEDGSEIRYCYYCSLSETRTVAAAHRIDESSWIIDVKPTCQSEGSRWAICTACGNMVSDVMPVDENAHSYSGANEGWQEIDKPCDVGATHYRVCTKDSSHVELKYANVPHKFNEDNWVITKTATCKEDGERWNICLVCGEKITEVISAGIDHHVLDAASWKVMAPSTCTVHGVETNTCSLCLKPIARELPLDEDAHNFVAEPQVLVAPTCCATGLGIYKCADCGAVETKVIPVDPDGHQFDGEWNITEAEGCVNGSKINTCKLCNNVINIVIPAPHSFDITTQWKIIKNPTCSKPGLKEAVCPDCRDTVSVEIPINENNHEYGSWVVVEESTCDKAGYQIRRCEHNYGHLDIKELPKAEHVYSTDWVVSKEPTCSEMGVEVNHCVICDRDIFRNIPIDNDAHSEENPWEIVKEPTCKEDGLKTKYCSICDKTIEIAIPAHSKTWKLYKEEKATCISDGTEYYYCTACGYEGTLAVERDKNAHNLVDKEIILYPTCSTEGKKWQVCTYCGYIPGYDKNHPDAGNPTVIPADGHHLLTSVVTDATCKQEGEKILKCSLCDKVVIRNKYILPHINDDWKFYDEGSNCEAGGTQYRYCLICGTQTGIRKVGKGEHALKTETKKATCRAEGYIRKTCSICDYVSVTTLPMTAHNNVVLKQGTPATCTEDGITDATYCLNCGLEVKQQVIKAYGHDFVENANGTKYCKNCYIFMGEDEKPCSCICHNQDGFSQLIFRIINFFNKLFGKNDVCECGKIHYEKTVK
ncbi:MAG: hypothetical protein ACI4GB_08730 [Acutalibacteraceae bacterium]